MRSLSRFAHEYSHLFQLLSAKDRSRLLARTAAQAPAIAKSRRLRALDAAMSHDLTVTYRGHPLHLPLAAIDRMVNAGQDDSFSFGTIREMLGNDVYLRAFHPDLHCNTAVDLGCNRGFFALIARIVLGATVVVGVEGQAKYGPVQELLAQKNNVPPPRTYFKLVGSAEDETAKPAEFVSIQTLLRENNLATIDFAKIDIEGYEAAIFSETSWLPITQNIAMELHPHFVDTTPVIAAVSRSGFDFICTDQFGVPCKPADAMFLYASRSGALLHSPPGDR